MVRENEINPLYIIWRPFLIRNYNHTFEYICYELYLQDKVVRLFLTNRTILKYLTLCSQKMWSLTSVCSFITQKRYIFKGPATLITGVLQLRLYMKNIKYKYRKVYILVVQDKYITIMAKVKSNTGKIARKLVNRRIFKCSPERIWLLLIVCMGSSLECK